MGLTPEQIKSLLAKKSAPRTGSTNKRKKHDPNDRSYQAWFALEHHFLSDEKEPMYCDNPDCIDPRDKSYGQPIVKLQFPWDEVKMCRYCFIEGWLRNDEPTS